jgi:hypothetical protein
MESEGLSFMVPILGVLLVIVSLRGCLQAVKQHRLDRKLKQRTDAEDIVHHEMYRSVIKPALQKAMRAFVGRHQAVSMCSNPMQLYAELYRDMGIGPQCFQQIVEGGVCALKIRNSGLSTRSATLLIRQAYYTTRIHQTCFLLLRQVSRVILCGNVQQHFASRSTPSLLSGCPSLVSN